MTRRVVVTGLGAIGPGGHTARDLWRSMVHARPGIDRIRSFDATGWPVQIAGEVRGFDPVARFGRREARRMDRFTWFGVVAAEEAWDDAGLADAGADPDRVGVYVGSGIAGLGEILRGAEGFAARGWKGISPFLIPRALTNLCAGVIAIRLQARGPCLAVSTACATGNHAIGEAFRAIREGDADVILAGGAEACILPMGLASFMVMRALSQRNDDPAGASRPFDADRDGFVMGEGAGVLVLEELGHARRRGARIYAELVGYGLTNDAHHLTAPGGNGAARCMSMALRSAGMAPDEVDAINAHGTSTPQNDVNETRAIHAVFGDHARRLMVSSTKGVTGHLLGAAGGVEAVASVLTLHEGLVPPTANWTTRDPECDLDYVPGEARPAPVRAVLSNSFGFGGANASLIFRRLAD